MTEKDRLHIIRDNPKKTIQVAVVTGDNHPNRNCLKIPEVSDSDSGEVSDTIPVDFRTLVLAS